MPFRTVRLVAVAAVASGSFVAVTSANVLVDPGFELNPLTTIANSVGNYPGFQGVWGQEVSTIVTTENGVTPAGGTKMLRMDDDGAIATQCTQVTDLTSFAAQIDAGQASVQASALYNVSQNLPAAISSIVVHFVDSTAIHGNTTGTDLVGVLNLDSSPNTWQPATTGGAIPVGTRWILTQVAYSDASLHVPGAVFPGYVDDADVEIKIAPEPATLLCLAAAPVVLLRRRTTAA